ncbi:MAG TPA: hypothetical protein VF787_27100 [Thermoanaerobaculia bacterium]
MKRLLLLCFAATAAFGAGSPATPMIEIVSATDTSVTYRELQPTRVALDPAGGVFHYKGCPLITAKMQWASPAAGTLHKLTPHAACAKNAGPEYATKTEKRIPRDPNHIAVLYLGNSLVYYNEVPGITSALGKNEKRSLRVDSVTRSGVSLKQLWETTPALKKLWLEHWDYVVLQGGGGGVGPVNRAEEFNTYLAKFNEQVRNSGAEPLFYMVWRQRLPNHNEASIESARRLKMRIAPVGVAWDDLVSTKRFERLDQDGVHPDARGAYLVAVTVYSTIYNKPAFGAPHDFAYLAASGEVYDDALREQTINETQARFIQDAAWRAVQKVR